MAQAQKPKLRVDSRIHAPFQTAKNVFDIAKKLDVKNKELKNVEDLLSPSFLDGKRQLTETFLALVKNQELDGLGRIEEAIWRKAFYEPYTVAKQSVQKSGKLESHSGILRSHLYSAVTFYSQFLQLVNATSRQATNDSRSLKDSEGRESSSEDTEDSHIETVHRVHLYLGDIYRYLSGLGIARVQSLAVQHYLEALNVIPDNGLPHNQLAALFSEENSGLNATYHYIACMSSKIKFEGGEKNLSTKVEDFVSKFQSTAKDSSRERLMYGFSIVATSFMGVKTNQDVSQVCQIVLKDLHEELRKSRQVEGGEEQSGKIDPQILLLMGAMCCFILNRISDKKKDFEVQLGFAFCLAYLSELLDCVIHEISDIMPEIPTEVPKVVPAKLKSRRRRRRRSSLTGEESSGSEAEEELSQLSDSSGSDLEIEESDSDSESKNVILKEYQQNQLAARLQNSDYVAPLALMCQCLTRLQQLLSGAGQGAFPLWSRMTKLANAMKDVGEPGNDVNALPEDWYISPIWRENGEVPKTTSEIKIRAKRIRNLERTLSDFPETGVTFDSGSGYFFCTEKPVEAKLEERKLDEDKARTMAAMWLRSEVSALENQLTSASCLVVDISVMLKQLRIVMKLSKRFILVVPTAVINQLDRAKKHNPDAREAIRWLEQEFQRGSRTVRPQRHGARKSLPAVKYPKRKEKNAWSFYQILECCLYLKENTGSDSAEVTLLIGESVAGLASQLTGKSPQGLCASIGVTLKTAQDFLKSIESPAREK